MAPLLSTPFKTPLFLLLILFFSNHGDAAQFIPNYLAYFCVDETFDLYQSNQLSTNALLSDLAAHSSSNTFYHSSSSLGGQNTSTYGLFYCTGYVSSQDCQTCVQAAAAAITGYCSYDYKTAMIVYEECTLRYSNSTVYATEDESVIVWYYNSYSVDSYIGFNDTLYSTLNAAITQAASTGYATSNARLVGTTNSLYTLAQCTPDILGSPCRACLQAALQLMPDCCNTSMSWAPKRTFIFTFLPSCQLRYTTNKTTFSSSSITGNNVWYMILALAVAAIALH